MNSRILPILLISALMFTAACLDRDKKVDIILTHGMIYSVDSVNTTYEAMAIRDGKITALGTHESITGKYRADEIIDLGGKPVYPGFIDAHSHFTGYARGLAYVDLGGCKSYDEVLMRLKSSGTYEKGEWILGRGWDQNLWAVKNFPDNEKLNAVYPENPVMLIRVDGHVVLTNQYALTMLGIERSHAFKEGEVRIVNGRLTGILAENAADFIREKATRSTGNELIELLMQAQQKCLRVGLTGVCDAGLEPDDVKLLDSLQRAGALKLSVYAMLTPDSRSIREYVLKGPYITDKLSVRSIKIYADGSLGSRTAMLKGPYSDAPESSGIEVTPPDSISLLCKLAYENGYQVNTHCIGDAAVEMVLKIYGSFLKQKNDLRWRIEHAQVVDPSDFHYFRDFSVVPSVQATHATSDMNWAGDRLGVTRVKGAYAYKELLSQNGWLPNGTDFPIERIDPILTFYASVARKDLKGNPPMGFQIENALSRDEALRSITIWAAKAGFTEKHKGSLEPGKDADFVILSQDLMSISEDQIPGTDVLKTYIGGIQAP